MLPRALPGPVSQVIRIWQQAAASPQAPLACSVWMQPLPMVKLPLVGLAVSQLPWLFPTPTTLARFCPGYTPPPHSSLYLAYSHALSLLWAPVLLLMHLARLRCQESPLPRFSRGRPPQLQLYRPFFRTLLLRRAQGLCTCWEVVGVTGAPNNIDTALANRVRLISEPDRCLNSLHKQNLAHGPEDGRGGCLHKMENSPVPRW